MRHFETLLQRIYSLGPAARVEIVARVPGRDGAEHPLLRVSLGSDDPGARVLGLFGGVHGLERIGAETVITWLEILTAHAVWDRALARLLDEVRIVALPIVNPAGLVHGTRCNAQGVDLMRNAPIDAVGPVPFLLGGHRFGPWLPWFRGHRSGGLEPEAAALIEVVRSQLFPAPVAVALDVHSGFGRRDRLWYPYAKQRGGYPREGEALRFAALLDSTHPDNRYRVEPQSDSYTTHGDLWDHLFELHRSECPSERVFMPWTLELGSWSWAVRSPRLPSADVLFNPPTPNHSRRTVRKHYALLDFFIRAVNSPSGWIG